MDPLSIIGSVLSITTTCVTAAKTLNDIRDAWKRAPVTVSSLCSQLKLTAASLSQIQSLLLNDTDILHEKQELVETFDTTLTSCMVLSTWLEKHMQKITKGVLHGAKGTWKMKFKTVWNEGEVKELMQQLHTQQGAISVLVGLLQMDSISEIRKHVRRNEALLQEIANNTRNLRQTRSVQAPESILALDKANGSMFSKLARDHDNGDLSLEDSFESIVLNTKVYSKAFTSALNPASVDDSNDAKTITGNDLDHTEALSSTDNFSSILRPTLPVMQFASLPQPMQIAKNNRVTAIYAHSQAEYAPKHPGELTLTMHMIIRQIRKVNECWYWGQAAPSSDGGPSPKGLFERSKVTVSFELEKPLSIRTNRASLDGDFRKNYWLQYHKDDVLEVTHIVHGGAWWALNQTSAIRRVQQGGYVSVDGIELDELSRNDIDELLEFYAYNHPALSSFSLEELRDRVRDYLQRNGVPDRSLLARLSSHCASFAELQVLRLTYKEVFGTTGEAIKSVGNT